MAAEGAAAEDQGSGVVPVGGEVADPADHDPVVAGKMLLLELAVEVGHGLGDQG